MNKATLPPPSATLDVDVLRSVVAIAEEGTMAAAADRVARTPAALSMQIRKLEDMLGRTLFDRTRQGMTLTPAGEQLLTYARQMIALNRSAIEAFSLPELDGELNFGLLDSFDGYRLARVLSEFSCCHPKVRVNVVQSWTASMAPDLDHGLLDLAVLSPGGTTGLRDTDLILHDDPLAWIAKEGGRAAQQSPVPLAMAEEGCAWRKRVTEAMAQQSVQGRVAFESNVDMGQLAAVRADLAVAPMPSCYLEPGMIDLTGRPGFPFLGQSYLVLRLGPSPSMPVRALAARVAESYGKAFEPQNTP
ncbi:MAG: LysR family transcriptional regulator [Paracoccaceae bacterium]